MWKNWTQETDRITELWWGVLVIYLRTFIHCQSYRVTSFQYLVVVLPLALFVYSSFRLFFWSGKWSPLFFCNRFLYVTVHYAFFGAFVFIFLLDSLLSTITFLKHVNMVLMMKTFSSLNIRPLIEKEKLWSLLFLLQDISLMLLEKSRNSKY